MSEDELLTLDELTERVGLSIRNIRFYTSRGLVDPPIRQGRLGFYSPAHVERLQLIRELQEQGFTLAAIERYVSDTSTSAYAGLTELGLPPETIDQAAAIYRRHGRAIAQELTELFETAVVPAYEQSGASPEQLQELVEKLKPLSLAALISAYESALAERR